MLKLFTHFLSTIALLFICCSGLKAQQITFKTTFPLNEYLYTNSGSPYPIVNQKKIDAIDKSKFVNVMDYGAKGDGKTLDDNAIKKAFQAAKYGVIFPSGKTFMVSTISKVSLDHDLTVYAYGATIKMANLTRYSFLSLEYRSGYHNQVLWLGGTFDGNQYNQKWPGNPHGGKYNGSFVEVHGRFVGITNAEFAMFKDVNVLNTVVDGPTAESCKLAVFADSKASGGAPIWYDKQGDQGTYFKVTREGMKSAYFLNLDCRGGSIGTHLSYPTKSKMDQNILSVHVNCNFSNQAQDAVHIEDCYENFFYNCTVSADANGGFYQQRIHLSNRSGIVSVKNCKFTNAYVNFNQASSLKLGLVDGCTFSNGTGSKLGNLIGGYPHLSTHNTFSGSCRSQQMGAKNVRDCSFSNFGSVAVSGAQTTEGSNFTNGSTPVSASRSALVLNCTFKQVKTTSYNDKTSNNDWQKVFNSYIDVYSDAGKYLGRIDCGYSSRSTSQMTATSTQAAMSGNRSATSNFTGGTISNANVAITDSANATAHNNSKTILPAPAQITRVYPNPAVNVLNVLMNEQIAGKTALRIYDQQGRMVQTKMVDKQTAVLNETLNVQQLAAGAYILRIVSEHNQTDLKFIVAK